MSLPSSAVDAAPTPSALPSPLAVPPDWCDGPAGRLAWFMDGPADPIKTRPLLLIHSVNAAGTAAEVRPLFEYHAKHRPVVALDLPGFGLSERSARRYTPRLMTDALHQVLDAIAQRFGLQPVDALALSLSCEFLARAAVEAPSRFRSVALVSPTGFAGTRVRLGPPGATREVPGMYRLLNQPLWRESLYRGLTRPGVIRYFLKRAWGADAIDETLWAYDVQTTRVPGALWAPLDFLSATLFSADVNALYDALTQPVWMSHGVRGDFTDYRGAQRMLGRPNWRFSTFPTGALPHFEVLERFVADQAAFEATLG